MLTAKPKAEACWRAARPCAETESRPVDGISCWAWYRCENEGDYVIKWRCDVTANSGIDSENDTAFSLCADQSGLSTSYGDCPPPVVCADDPNQRAPVVMPEPGYLSTDLILVIAVVSFAVLAILLTIGSSYKYWSLRRRFQFPIKPGQYMLRDFPYPVRYHNLWGTRYSLSNYTTMDTSKRPPSSLSGDLHMLFPEVNRSRLNLVNVHGFKSQPQHPNTVSKPFYPDVYFSKHSADTVAVPRPPPRFHTVSGYPNGQGDSGKHFRASASTALASRPTGPFTFSWRDALCGKGEKEAMGQDSLEAAGSFVYHDPKGGSNPSWRIAGQGETEDSNVLVERGKEGREGNVGIGEWAKGMGFGHSSTDVGNDKGQSRESGTCKIRGDRAGEWWMQRMSRGGGQSLTSGDTRSHSSEEHIHIYRGNLNTTDIRRTKSESRTNSGALHATSRFAFGGVSYRDVTKPSHATPPDARVSSIAIPYHDTLQNDMRAGKSGIRFSNAEVYPAKEQTRKISLSDPSPNVCLRAQSNIYTELLDFNEGQELGNRYRHTGKDSAEHNAKGSRKKRKGTGRDSSRYLRVRGTVYRIVPTVNSSDSTSSNSLGSAASCSESGLATAVRVTDLDLSYDNFRDDHLRQLARRGGGVASSSTLDACTLPAEDCGEHSSSSSSSRDRYRF